MVHRPKTEEEAKAFLRSNRFGDVYVSSATWDCVGTVDAPNLADMLQGYLKENFPITLNGKGLGLYIHGKPGTGKTMLLTLIARYFVRNFLCSIRYVTARDLSDWYRDRKNFETEIRAVENSHVVMLDELGHEHMTEYSLRALAEFVDKRYRDRKPTFIASNQSIEEWAKTTGYVHVADRLQDLSWLMELHYSGESKRRNSN